MWITVFWVFYICVSTIAGIVTNFRSDGPRKREKKFKSVRLLILGSLELQPTVITELHNAFSNLSSLALMPELMQTAECRRDCEIYRDAFFKNEIWALEIFDANGRLSSGVLKGNIQQKGNMRECIYVSSEKNKIKGKFCIAQFYIKPIRKNTSIGEVYDKIFNTPLVLLEPYEDAASPATNTILNGLCVPSSCTTSELTFASRKILSVYNHSKFDMAIHFDDMKDRNCMIKEEFINESSFIRAIKNFLITVSILVFIATLADVFLLQDTQRDTQRRMVIIARSFSLAQNWKTLFNVENDRKLLPWMNGARCVFYFFMFTIHYVARLLVFTVNRADAHELLNNPYLACLARNGLILLDLLILLNGITHSYKITKLVEQNKIATMTKLIFYRYLRLLIIISVFVFFGLSVLHKNEITLMYTPKRNKIDIWSLIFCYENFFGLDYMFFAPSHTFFTDVQLYIFGCVLLTIMKKRQNKFKIFFGSIVLTLLFRSIFLYFNSNTFAFMMFGMTMEQFMNMMTYVYIISFGRLPFYIAGLALGYYTQQNVEDYDIPPLMRQIGWSVALCCLYIVAFCYYSFDNNYQYNSYDGAKISFIHSFCLIILLTWLFWDCHLFENSPVTKFLSAKQFVVLNRLTPYFSFLHILVLFNSYGDKGTPSEFTLIGIFGLDYMFFVILLCAFIMLFVHLPAKNLWRFLTHGNGENTKTN